MCNCLFLPSSHKVWCAVTLPLHYRYIAVTLPLHYRYIAVTLPLQGAQYTLSCDVYSYAIFLLELEAFALVHGRLVRSDRTCKRMLGGWRPPSTWLRGVPLLWLIQACQGCNLM